MKIMVVDDEQPILDMLDITLSAEGYEVLTAEDGEKALEIFEKEHPMLILTDIKMPRIDGIEVLKRIKADNPDVEIIVITGHGDMDTAVSALQNGASDFVTKPIRDEVLTIALERAKKKLSMSSQLRDYTENLERKVDACKVDLEQAQDQLIRTERLATIGETVAGLAHCIKNILTGLGGGMYMVHAGIAKDKHDMLEDGWAMFQRNLERVSDLVLDLLRYSRQTTLDRALCKPNQIVADVVKFLEPEAIRHNIRLIKDLDPDLKEAFIEYDGVQRVLANLVENAVDACIYDTAISKEWKVTVRTKKESDTRPGEASMLFEISDNGCGMTDGVQRQLFQKFFSTKAGRGTGFGLLVSQKIIHEHGGEISVKSKAGEGTTVVIRL